MDAERLETRLSGKTHISTTPEANFRHDQHYDGRKVGASPPTKMRARYETPPEKMRARYETPPEKRAKRDEEVKDRLRAMFGRQRG